MHSKSTLAAALVLTTAALAAADPPAAAPHANSGKLQIVSQNSTDAEPAIHMASYAGAQGQTLLGRTSISRDFGRHWETFSTTPDFAAGLPFGYRRENFPAVFDSNTGRILLAYNALDTPGLDPNAIEPPGSLEGYYLRYRVSADGGRTWLFDEPIVQAGHNEANPLPGIQKGKNGVFFGDIGSTPLFTRKGEILVPVETCLLGPDGKLATPGGGFTYHEVTVLCGVWQNDARIDWRTSAHIIGDPQQTARGIFEPTLAEFPDGRILMIMRGSNERGSDYSLPGHKWRSVSQDGGHSWSKPEPWTDTSGKMLPSPSSMSQLLRHSSGRVFWFGNLSSDAIRGNSPRWPLIVAEVDPNTLTLLTDSIVVIDTRRDTDPEVVDISHFRTQEDLSSHEIVLTYPRALNNYQSIRWISCRLAGPSSIE
jgi:hypothetical protein